MKVAKRRVGTSKRVSEDAILGRVERIVTRPESVVAQTWLGMGDDAALFKAASGFHEILTCDWFLEGTHFLREKHPPESVGWKCLARALSDVAAMGGVPRCFLLSLALPATHTGQWLDRFLNGLRRASMRFGCALAGGDTSRNQKILLNVSVVGEVRAGQAVLRAGARPGDLLFTSGRLGEAELGLELIRGTNGQARSHDSLLRKHLYPEPRLALGRWLGERRLASAMMDLSDGLSTDLPRLCKASGVGARIEARKIPAVRIPRGCHLRAHDSLDLALHGGDDYELLFTVAPKLLPRIPRSFRGLPITSIGEITKAPAVLLIDLARRKVSLPNRGWDPFRELRQA